MGSGADYDEFLDVFPRGMGIKVGIQIILGMIRFVEGSAGIAGANMNSIVAASSWLQFLRDLPGQASLVRCPRSVASHLQYSEPLRPSYWWQ